MMELFSHTDERFVTWERTCRCGLTRLAIPVYFLGRLQKLFGYFLCLKVSNGLKIGSLVLKSNDHDRVILKITVQ